MNNIQKPGLYIHIPFCVKKCNYCDFFSLGANDLSCRSGSDIYSSYASALLNEAKYLAECAMRRILRCGALTPEAYDTVYIGGGTPSLLPPENIIELVHILRTSFDIPYDAEITIEANPGTLTDAKLKAYREAVINRISIGVQSLDDAQLGFLGRIHNSKEAEEAVTLAKRYFENINVDFIFGIPGLSGISTSETLKNVRDKASFVIDRELPHVSFYSLITEPGTPLYSWDRAGRLDRVEDELEREMYYDFCNILQSHGYGQYEISNFALPGFESRHNLKYWSGAAYTGIGAGAVSFLPAPEDGQFVRFRNVPDIGTYINTYALSSCKDSCRLPETRGVSEIQEVLDVDARKKEYMMLGFRKTKGPDPELYSQLFGGALLSEDFCQEIDELIKSGYVRNDLSLTRKGLDMGNEIFMKFV
ncbi:MAG: radical SAM family heme chaperone HemW [Clostridia bacterium]|nr:radical SAM family heme chaperone HemW [Clostridia bacterium]